MAFAINSIAHNPRHCGLEWPRSQKSRSPSFVTSGARKRLITGDGEPTWNGRVDVKVQRTRAASRARFGPDHGPWTGPDQGLWQLGPDRTGPSSGSSGPDRTGPRSLAARTGPDRTKLRQFRTGPDQTTDHGPKIYGENNNDFGYLSIMIQK